MTVRTLDYLKTRFETGDYPTQTDFSDWLDTMAAMATDLAGIPVLWVAEEADLSALIGLVDGQWVGVGTDPPGTFRRWNATEEVFELLARPVLWVPDEAALTTLATLTLVNGQQIIVGTDPPGTVRNWDATGETFAATELQTVTAAAVAASSPPGRIYLLTADLSDGPGFEVMNLSGSTRTTAATATASVREETEWVEIGRWLTPPGEPGVTMFPAGDYTALAQLDVSNATDLSNVRWRLLHVAGALLTQIGTVTVPVTDTTPTRIAASIPVAAAVTVSAPDRLGLVLEAESRSLVDYVTVTLTYDGPATASLATPILGAPAADRVYPIAVYFAGQPDGGAKIRTVLVSDVLLPAGLPGLQLDCETNPDATVAVVVTRYSAGIAAGTATLNVATDGTWAWSGMGWAFDQFGEAGDVVEFALPEIADATLAGLAITLKGVVS